MKKLLPVGIIIVVVILVVAFLSNGDKSSNNNGPKKVGESQIEQKEEAEQKEFKILDKIDFENRVLTVNSIQRNFVESSSYPFRPDEGQEFVLVNVTIENNSEKVVSFNTYDFQIENSSGVRTSSAYVGSVKDELHSGDLAVGGKITANISFEVKKNGTGLKLIFKPSFWSDREVIVALD